MYQDALSELKKKKSL